VTVVLKSGRGKLSMGRRSCRILTVKAIAHADFWV